MNYYSTKLGTGPHKVKVWKRIVARILMTIFPKANPDFEDKFDDVRQWWLELDDLNIPRREIGFNAANEVIVEAPIDDNFGYWTDSDEPVNIDDRFQTIDSSSFQDIWNEFEKNWQDKKSMRWLTTLKRNLDKNHRDK